jgi:hypothetical protein
MEWTMTNGLLDELNITEPDAVAGGSIISYIREHMPKDVPWPTGPLPSMTPGGPVGGTGSGSSSGGTCPTGGCHQM